MEAWNGDEEACRGCDGWFHGPRVGGVVSGREGGKLLENCMSMYTLAPMPEPGSSGWTFPVGSVGLLVGWTKPVDWSGSLSASPCVPHPPQPSLWPITVIVLNHKTGHVTLLTLHCTWLPFAPEIKSKLITMAHEGPA